MLLKNQWLWFYVVFKFASFNQLTVSKIYITHFTQPWHYFGVIKSRSRSCVKVVHTCVFHDNWSYYVGWILLAVPLKLHKYLLKLYGNLRYVVFIRDTCQRCSRSWVSCLIIAAVSSLHL